MQTVHLTSEEAISNASEIIIIIMDHVKHVDMVLTGARPQVRSLTRGLPARNNTPTS